VVTPGITIRDRLRVLLPNDPGNYYRAMDLAPADLYTQLGQARVLITNFHAFLLREKVPAGQAHKELLAAATTAPSRRPPTRWCGACAAS